MRQVGLCALLRSVAAQMFEPVNRPFANQPLGPELLESPGHHCLARFRATRSFSGIVPVAC